jgi:hypothetical protein
MLFSFLALICVLDSGAASKKAKGPVYAAGLRPGWQQHQFPATPSPVDHSHGPTASASAVPPIDLAAWNNTAEDEGDEENLATGGLSDNDEAEQLERAGIEETKKPQAEFRYRFMKQSNSAIVAKPVSVNVDDQAMLSTSGSDVPI